MRISTVQLMGFVMGLLAVSSSSAVLAAESFAEALTTGTTKGDFRLRYESVEQDNTLDDATALTLRSKINYTTASLKGWLATMEFEDSRIVGGQRDFTVGPTGFNPGEFSVIADPNHTELDQGFLQYKNEAFSTKLGRQVITHDGHRFVGHVGWRQDRQTFDAATVSYKANDELNLTYSYLGQRNRIFAEAADIDSKDHLANANYKTPAGTLVVYAYMLELDNDTDNARDTFGARFGGSSMMDEMKLLYHVEFASQSSDSGGLEYDANYTLVEAGAVLSGITGKLSYEFLGSDDANYGFATPLATLHKFNGWADQWLATPTVGLIDTYVTLSSKVGKGKLTLVYHNFEAAESTSAIDDLGSEIDVVYGKKYGKNYSVGLKYAAYSAGDLAATKVDTDKAWVWVGASF